MKRTGKSLLGLAFHGAAVPFAGYHAGKFAEDLLKKKSIGDAGERRIGGIGANFVTQAVFGKGLGGGFTSGSQTADATDSRI